MNRARSGVKVARALHETEHAIDSAMKARARPTQPWRQARP